MSNQSNLANTNQLNPSKTLDKFDYLIETIYSSYQNNNIVDMVATLKPLIKNNGQFMNIVSALVNNSTHHHDQYCYENFDLCAGALLSEFTPQEQLCLIANMDKYGIGENGKIVELLKYFLRKILKERLIDNHNHLHQ